MIRPSAVIVAVALLAACGSDTRPINIPEVAPGASEAACQQLCMRAEGDEGCGVKHAEFCVASCRVRTNGMTAACATCLVAAGEPMHGAINSLDEPTCVIGGPAELGACSVECDD